MGEALGSARLERAPRRQARLRPSLLVQAYRNRTSR